MPNVVREVIQNSLDAATHRGDPPHVHIKFELIEVSRKDFGGDHLLSHMESAHQSLQQSNFTNTNRANWIVDGIKLLKRDKIPCLKIVETGTTGLTEEHWEALIETEGGAYKDTDNPGGSFGIGKTAVFALSDLRSVIYSTLYVKLEEGRVEKATGKSRLITHPNPKNSKERLQHIGFWRASKGSREPIVGDDIPSVFQLSETGSTGIFILGCRLAKDWIKKISESVVDNYFAAINGKHLVVTISDRKKKGTTIDHETLHSIFFDKESHTKNGEYYRVLRDKKAIQLPDPLFQFTDLSEGLRCNIYLTIHENDDITRGVATINRRGMFITDSSEQGSNPFAVRGAGTWKPFTLLVEPSNDQTDKWLRKLEPPTHTEYDIGRAPKEQQENIRKMFRQVRRDIKELIDKKLGIGKTKVVNVGALSHLLPDTNLSNDDTANSNHTIIEISSRPRSNLYSGPENEPAYTEPDDPPEDDLDPEPPDDPPPIHPDPDDTNNGHEIVTDQVTPTQREHQRSSIINPRVISVGNNTLQISITIDPESLPDNGITHLQILPQGEKLRREPPLQISQISLKDMTSSPARIYIHPETGEVVLEAQSEKINEPIRMTFKATLTEEAEHIMLLTPGYIVEAR